MTKPKMIIFDYGQTLLDERIGANSLEASEAVLSNCVVDRKGCTAEQYMNLCQTLRRHVNHPPENEDKFTHIEPFEHKLINYIFEYFELEPSMPADQIEQTFWFTSSPAKPTEHIEELLEYLFAAGVRKR